METQLGVRLFHRTTRSVRPTEAGKRLLEWLRSALTEVEAALDVVNGFCDRPAGTLKLNVPISAARLVLPSIVPAFLAAYPDISLVSALKMQAAAGMLTDAVVQKIDPASGMIVLKHGDIPNLGMPGMTMGFDVADRKMLDQVKVGDKVRFHVEIVQGRPTVTHLEAAR